jgi:hypothetical protein
MGATRTFPYVEEIEVSRLRLDLRNPRLPGEPVGQLEGLSQMASAQRDKLVALCRHIAINGLNPAQRFLVAPYGDGTFVVLDGNRRLTALRALESPEIVEGGLNAAQLKQILAMANEAHAIHDVPCVVFETRQHADIWIEIQHQGESNGAGLVKWTGQQAALHRSRRGPKPPHIKVLEFAQDVGDLSTATKLRIENGTFPVTTLRRVLTTPEVRDRLGIRFGGGEVLTRYPREEVAKGLSRVVDDIGSSRKKVGDVMSSEQRVAYARSLPASALPDAATLGGDFLTLDQAIPGASGTRRRKGEKASASMRKHIIPDAYRPIIAKSKIHDVYRELKFKLDVDETPVAAGADLRVFLELSVDEFGERHNVPKFDVRSNLAKKVDTVADWMEAQGLTTDKQMATTRQAVGPEQAVTTFHAILHNREFTATAKELKEMWARLEPFFEQLWPADQ